MRQHSDGAEPSSRHRCGGDGLGSGDRLDPGDEDRAEDAEHEADGVDDAVADRPRLAVGRDRRRRLRVRRRGSGRRPRGR